MIKAAFFDIDGTLLSFRTHRVSDGTRRAFDRLHSHGVRTFIATGRPMAIVPEMPLTFDGHVTMNGALVFTPRQVLVANPIPDADYQAWLDYALANRLCTMVFTEHGMFASQLNATAIAVRDQLEFPMPSVREIDQLRDLTAFQIIALMPAMADSEVAAVMPSCSLPRWHPAFTDIVCGNNSKSAGLAAMCRHFGIAQSETIAFGDGGNDIDMLRWAAIGVAMGNASVAVKEAADIVTTDVDNEGIEHAIDKILQS